MHIIIGTNGKVIEISPISGPEMLRKAYLDAVRTWEYRPFVVDGKPVEVDTLVTVIMDFGA